MNESSVFKAYAPEFRMTGDRIRVLYTPEDFYQTIKKLLPTAKRRIVLSSLYIGTGDLELQLVNSINDALSNTNNDLKVQILLDYNRGCRGPSSSRALLLPLLNRQRNVQIAFFHTPCLRGFSKTVLPERWNEVIGLQHMKIYVVDDVVLMSGANLSHDYFTNRQDRYVVLEDGKLADFFQSLVATVSSFSIQLNSDNSESLHKDWKIHPFQDDYTAFQTEAKRRVEDLISSWKCESFENSPPVTKCLLNKLGISQVRKETSNTDSKVYPLIQMGPFNITYDEDATNSLFRSVPVSSRIQLATGYFNLTPLYSHMITNKSKSEFQILTASEKANGFLGGRGISGSIPKLYSYLAKIFLNKVAIANQSKRVFINEYERNGWTFHAKGLWYYPPGSLVPSVTLIGSPNFGCRSVYKDLEAQVAIVTSNASLMKQLHDEQYRLYHQSSPLTQIALSKPERYIPLWVRLFAKVFKKYF